MTTDPYMLIENQDLLTNFTNINTMEDKKSSKLPNLQELKKVLLVLSHSDSVKIIGGGKSVVDIRTTTQGVGTITPQ